VKRVVFLFLVFLVLTSAVNAFDVSARVLTEYPLGPAFGRTDVGIMYEWEYILSVYGFGVGIVFDGGDYNLWISDWDAGDFGLYEFDQDGDAQSGYIPTTDNLATNDVAYSTRDGGWIVGDHGASAVETYTDSHPYFAASIDGPPSWVRVFGVAYDTDLNVVYIGDDAAHIAYGTMTDLYSPVVWTELAGPAGEQITGLGLTPDDDYLFALAREATGDPPTQLSAHIYVYDVDASGAPDTSSPAFTYDVSGITTLVAGAEWDGDYLWIMDQRDTDTMMKLALDGISPSTNIEPASFGSIKARFK
jgi:hypothetical protein